MTPEELAERRSELDTYWAAEAPLRRRSTIEVFPLPQVPDSDVIHGTLIRATHDDELREIAQDFGRMFKQELRFDSPPFRTSYEQGAQEVYLIKSKRVLMLSPVACGAVGFEPALNHLEWIWIHPFDRGKGLIDRAWDALEMLYGSEFTLEQPVSPAMQAFLRNRGGYPGSVGRTDRQGRGRGAWRGVRSQAGWQCTGYRCPTVTCLRCGGW